MPILRKAFDQDAKLVGYVMQCPGCKQYHLIHTETPNSCNAQWGFNGNMECPTFSPSVNVSPNEPKYRCHFFIRDGRIEYCPDSAHALAGKTVPMVECDWGD